MSLMGRALHRVVRGYQSLFAWRPSPCRFVPTCSNYALDALETHGVIKGSWLTARRLGRCHPWGGHGWDPVPDTSTQSDVEQVRDAGLLAPVGESPESMEQRCSI